MALPLAMAFPPAENRYTDLALQETDKLMGVFVTVKAEVPTAVDKDLNLARLYHQLIDFEWELKRIKQTSLHPDRAEHIVYEFNDAWRPLSDIFFDFTHTTGALVQLPNVDPGAVELIDRLRGADYWGRLQQPLAVFFSFSKKWFPKA